MVDESGGVVRIRGGERVHEKVTIGFCYMTSVSVIAHLMLTSRVYVGRPAEELMMNSSLESRCRQSQMTVR
jgi:hypothetical protein